MKEIENKESQFKQEIQEILKRPHENLSTFKDVSRLVKHTLLFDQDEEIKMPNTTDSGSLNNRLKLFYFFLIERLIQNDNVKKNLMELISPQLKQEVLEWNQVNLLIIKVLAKIFLK